MAEKAEDKKDVPLDAPWTQNLRHRPDPNRVSSPRTPEQPSVLESRPLASQLPPDTKTRYERPITSLGALRHDPQARPAEPSYYDVPMLKQPVWKWQIASYFYLGGLSAGAYVLGRVADRAGGYRRLAKIASYTAMAALLPCPGLLIWDLGDPKRFHHMLRVWKPSSPMNFGSWVITAYGGMAAFEVARQYLNARSPHLHDAQAGNLQKLMNNGLVLLLHDVAGVPFALLVASYTGVLLSCTSNPLWCKNPWLAPLFASSAISTGAEAVSLAMNLLAGEDQQGQDQLQWIDTIAHIVELAMMRGFLNRAGEKAAALKTGRMKKHHQFSTGAIVAAEIIKRLPMPRALQRKQRILASALGLAGGWALRWAMVFGGHEAAGNPRTARLSSQLPKRSL